MSNKKKCKRAEPEPEIRPIDELPEFIRAADDEARKRGVSLDEVLAEQYGLAPVISSAALSAILSAWAARPLPRYGLVSVRPPAPEYSSHREPL